MLRVVTVGPSREKCVYRRRERDLLGILCEWYISFGDNVTRLYLY
jgi:hypothetical protein